MTTWMPWGLVAMLLALDVVVAWQWVRVVIEAPPALRPTALRTAVLWALTMVMVWVALGAVFPRR